MTDCPRLGKLFGGCKFSPRYDTHGPTDPMIVALTGGVGWNQPSQPHRRLYIGDVCERCGKTLFRRKQPPSTGGGQ